MFLHFVDYSWSLWMGFRWLIHCPALLNSAPLCVAPSHLATSKQPLYPLGWPEPPLWLLKRTHGSGFSVSLAETRDKSGFSGSLTETKDSFLYQALHELSWEFHTGRKPLDTMACSLPSKSMGIHLQERYQWTWRGQRLKICVVWN